MKCLNHTGRNLLLFRLNPLLSKRFHTIIIRNRVVIAFLFVPLHTFDNCTYQIIHKGKKNI